MWNRSTKESCEICNGGISTLCRISEVEINSDYNAYLIYTIQIKSGNLWNKNISKKQKFLYHKIKNFRSEGLTYQQISDYFNSKGIKTIRGFKFSQSGVHSIIKKMEKRFKRQNEEEIKIINMDIRYDKKI